MLNQQRMMADPFELMMRSMRRSVEDDIDEDLNEARSIAEQYFNNYRPS